MPYYYTPFRSDYRPTSVKEQTQEKCVFCNTDLMNKQALVNSDSTVFENEYYRWVVNWFPRAEAHTMLIPKRHITDIADETREEIIARHDLLKVVVEALQNAFTETGFELFLQTGKGSLSSIKHLHWHLIPTAPQKEFLSLAKLGYFWTTEPEEEKVVMQPVEITIAREELIKHIAAHN